MFCFMKKVIAGKEYDTERSTAVRKKVFGNFGDPEGYEEVLFVTEEGNYFLYSKGGEGSKYPKENIKRLSAKAAEEWKNSDQ